MDVELVLHKSTHFVFCSSHSTTSLGPSLASDVVLRSGGYPGFLVFKYINEHGVKRDKDNLHCVCKIVDAMYYSDKENQRDVHMERSSTTHLG